MADDEMPPGIRKRTDAEWDRTRRLALSPQRPDEWPEGVRAISLDGLALLGVHAQTRELYWDGRQLLMRSRVRLGTFERWIASIAALGTFGNFFVQLGRSLHWWL